MFWTHITRPTAALRAIAAAITVTSLAIPAAQAQTAVYSNVVGYHRLDVPSNGLALVSTPLDPGTNTSVQAVIGPQMTGGSGYSSADRIRFWDPVADEYVRIWRISHTDPSINGKWITFDGTAFAANGIANGSGFWLENVQSSNQTVMLVGDLVTDVVITNTVVPGLQLLSNPFSWEIPLNSAGLTNGTAGSGFADSDRIRLWDPADQEYQRFFLLDHVNPAFDRKWVDVSTGQLATNLLHTGDGFWYESKLPSNTFEWVVSRPYALP